MRIAIVGSGAVGGYYGARLAQAGHDMTFVARGAHLRAIRERGLLIWSPLGDFELRAPAESDTGRIGIVDAVVTIDSA
jgi:2-dehydropantoate 2-reductase